MTVAPTTTRPDHPVSLLGNPGAREVPVPLATRLYEQLVTGRRFNDMATALALQGTLAVYPSTTGQEACQVGAALALDEGDWLFPTYRDIVAVVARGVDPVEALTLMRGDWHNGYDPVATRVAPLCTPLATHCAHAVGLAHAARLAGDEVAVLALLGDGATSEGDFHEAMTLAGVLDAPVVFLVQNNGYAISVPVSRQCAADSLADKGAGYGVAATQVDGNDVLAVHSVLAQALERARSGGGPTLVEALTYRVEGHTTTDDPTRYRTDAEVEPWRHRDPLLLMERHLRASGALDDAGVDAAADAADRLVRSWRARLTQPAAGGPEDLYRHVYAELPPHLAQQRAALLARPDTADGGAR
ncbi:thiamine pyrophosphate-dependent enzyme [Streptomyces sp. NPDC007991]|uniref:thiamine pyrophosphate-dependent enzyme n=1 Tax=Streptomyces sp. NPDC007991 TaxID=3364803 RepID=UPI0036EB16F0